MESVTLTHDQFTKLVEAITALMNETEIAAANRRALGTRRKSPADLALAYF
jgi:hypothetical protein